MTATVHQLAVSKGGVPKLPVPEVLVHELGLAGDKQKHTKIHGGPQRAVCLYALERIAQLQAEGHPITPGSTDSVRSASAVTPPGYVLVSDCVAIRDTPPT